MPAPKKATAAAVSRALTALPWAQFDGPEPRRAPDREADCCNAGEPKDPSSWCRWHGKEHRYCDTCKGWYGVPHDGIHEDGPVRAAHPFGSNPSDMCACRPCRTYRAMTADEVTAALTAYDLAQAEA